MGQPDAAEYRSRLFYTLVEANLKQLDRELAAVKAVQFLSEYPWTPGKRLRPITFLLSNFSVRVERNTTIAANGRESRLAAAIELMHEASLVHDDLVDRSSVRRGVPTIQMKNGEGLALLIGDYMIFRGLKLVLDSAQSREDIALAQELANTGLEIAHGEANQLDRFLNRRTPLERMSIENYLDVIAKKTAAFFAGCAEAGAALGGAPRALREVYRTFGMNMGLHFQMVDDLMDIAGDPAVANKSLRNNISEGTVTLPMIHAWRIHPDDPDLLALAECKALPARRRATLYRKLASNEVLTKCQETMTVYAAKAEAALSQMPVNIYRAGLADLLDYIRQGPWTGLAGRINSGSAHHG
jgi:geranylgeranyl pyrophosphate synthase